MSASPTSDNTSSHNHDLLQASTVYAENMIAARVNPTSRTVYEGRLRCIRQWLQRNGYEEHLTPDSFCTPLPHSVIFQFFGHLTAKAQQITASKRKISAICTDLENKAEYPTTDSPNKRHKNSDTAISVSTVRGYKSALLWKYNNQKIKLDPALNSELEGLIKGYQRTVATLKQSGDMDIQEGKDALSFIAYRMIAEKLAAFSDLRDSTSSSTFAWAFFVFQWNLIARSETVTSILLDHISWKQDALLIFVPKHKADQEGRRSDQPVHVYANPLQPAICPILALAVLIFSKSFRTTPRLFEGKLNCSL